MGYAALDSSILDSSLWDESEDVRLVWITLLAMSDRNGYVKTNLRGLSKRVNFIGIGIDEAMLRVQKCVNRLSSPDIESRCKENEGRRLEEVDGGWTILNYWLYREQAREQKQREDTAKRVAKYRNKPSNEESVSSNAKTVTVRNVTQIPPTPTPTPYQLNNNKVAEALQIVGVVGLGLKAILGKVNTVAEVFLLAEQAKLAKARNVPAWIVARLKNGYEPPRLVQAQTICGWQERLASVCGHALNDSVRLKYDAAGNLIVRETDELEVIINPNDLSPNSIEFR